MIKRTTVRLTSAASILAAGMLMLAVSGGSAAYSAGNGAIVFVRAGVVQGSDVTTPHAGFHPAVSPNGAKIAFDNGVNLWTMDINGANAAPVPGPIVGTNPSWSPDGTTLAYVNAFGNILTVPVGGGATSQRTSSGTANGKPPSARTKKTASPGWSPGITACGSSPAPPT